MLKQAPMKSLFIALVLMSPWFANAADTVSGVLIRNGGDLSIRLSTDETRVYRLVSSKSEVQRVLVRLNTDDAVVGSADIDSVKNVAQLQTLDFVGLRRIIGYWSGASNNSVVNFKNYSDMNVYSVGNGGGGRISKQFKYTLAPSNGNDWAFFLADASKTQVGLLDLRDQQATLRLFDPDTGEVTQVLRLQKLIQ